LPDRPLTTQFRLLGIFPLLFFAAQAVHYWDIKQLGHLLWMCNVGNVLLGIGMLMSKPRLIRVAVIWSIPGLFIWWRYVANEWFGYATLDWWAVTSSTLAHIGGIAIGMIALQRVRIDRVTWLYAFVWYLAIQLVSRIVTRVELNVNVSQRVYAGWDLPFQSYLKFWIVLTLAVAACLWILTQAFVKVWPCKT
jgi:hypothetical protein